MSEEWNRGAYIFACWKAGLPIFKTCPNPFLAARRCIIELLKWKAMEDLSTLTDAQLDELRLDLEHDLDLGDEGPRAWMESAVDRLARELHEKGLADTAEMLAQAEAEIALRFGKAIGAV